MSETIRDLWPGEIDVTSVIPPAVILREQAASLAGRTKGLVRGEVESEKADLGEIDEYLKEVASHHKLVHYVHTLYLVVPSLDRYRYSLLSVLHDFQPYPCHASFHPAPTDSRVSDWRGTACLESERGFIDWLRVAFQRPETVRVIHALISQVREPDNISS